MSQTPRDMDQVARAFDADWASQYRQLDRKNLEPGAAGSHYCAILDRLTATYDRPISVLDVGCGTGRYFHALNQVASLVGIDISSQMLEYAKHPINAERVSIPSIKLLCGDFLTLDLPIGGFDLVYSIGVFGEYSPLDERTVRRFRELLAPRGTLLVTAVDSTSRVSEPENSPPSFGRRLVRKLFPALPLGLRRTLNRQLSPHYVSRARIEAVFAAAGFSHVSLEQYVQTSGWRGTHWECTAIRD